MRRVWLINLEDTIGPEHAGHILDSYLLRYLPLVRGGDCFITPHKLNPDFVNYIRRIRNLPEPETWLTVLDSVSELYSLCASVRKNENVLKHLRRLGATGEYALHPFIQTAGALQLAQDCGLHWTGTAPGAVKNGYPLLLNDKAHFKEVSKTLGINAIPGFIENTPDGIKKSAHELAGGTNRQIIIKKAFSGGGYGNYAGTLDHVLSYAAQWHKGETVLVEPYEDFATVCGTLAEITEDGCFFLGTDKQLIHNAAWRGCEYPFGNKALNSELKELSLRYARHFRENGARGYVNLDWGIKKNREIMAIECNFRLNGFSHIIEIAKSCFGFSRGKTKIKFLSAFPANGRTSVFSAADELNGKFQGRVLPLGVPNRGLVPVFLAAGNEADLEEIHTETEIYFNA
ncbi:MAG: hypothetical protein WCS77_10715 [Elusimicrobiaceae bacterium]